MSSSSKSTHDYSRKLRRAILEPWRQSHNLPPSPLPNRNTLTSPSTTNSSPSLSPPQNPSPNQITHELHHLSNLLEINLQQAIDATNPSPPTSPCIPPPSLDQDVLRSIRCPSGERLSKDRRGTYLSYEELDVFLLACVDRFGLIAKSTEEDSRLLWWLTRMDYETINTKK
ncbi:hypothetical protein Tco_0493382 [Tanacetum coccineum]